MSTTDELAAEALFAVEYGLSSVVTIETARRQSDRAAAYVLLRFCMVFSASV
jgi:hypothetical protein